MRVYIGPYTNWFGPYQIVDKVFFWLDDHPSLENEKRPIYKFKDWLGDFLGGRSNKRETWLYKFCNWIHEKKKRTVRIRVDNYDVWGAGHTLALIITPVLKKLKERKNGSPITDLSDVPEHLWPATMAGPANNYTDDTIHERWEWVLNEIIWAMEQESTDDDESQFYDHSGAKDPSDDLSTQVSRIKVDRDGLEAHQERKRNGLRLFGKYYQSLWD